MRRWLLVFFFLGSVLLGAATWGMSYLRYMLVCYDSKYSLMYHVLDGSSYFRGGHWGPTGVPFHVGQIDEFTAATPSYFYSNSRFHFLGFAFDPAFITTPTEDDWLVIIPLWFPTSLGGLGLLLAWRRKKRLDSRSSKGSQWVPRL